MTFFFFSLGLNSKVFFIGQNFVVIMSPFAKSQVFYRFSDEVYFQVRCCNNPFTKSQLFYIYLVMKYVFKSVVAIILLGSIFFSNVTFYKGR